MARLFRGLRARILHELARHVGYFFRSVRQLDFVRTAMGHYHDGPGGGAAGLVEGELLFKWLIRARLGWGTVQLRPLIFT